jgi:hypothetical protein
MSQRPAWPEAPRRGRRALSDRELGHSAQHPTLPSKALGGNRQTIERAGESPGAEARPCQRIVTGARQDKSNCVEPPSSVGRGPAQPRYPSPRFGRGPPARRAGEDLHSVSRFQRALPIRDSALEQYRNTGLAFLLQLDPIRMLQAARNLLSRFSRERGGTQAEGLGGEGLAESAEKTLTSQPLRGRPPPLRRKPGEARSAASSRPTGPSSPPAAFAAAPAAAVAPAAPAAPRLLSGSYRRGTRQAPSPSRGGP